MEPNGGFATATLAHGIIMDIYIYTTQLRIINIFLKGMQDWPSNRIYQKLQS